MLKDSAGAFGVAAMDADQGVAKAVGQLGVPFHQPRERAQLSAAITATDRGQTPGRQWRDVDAQDDSWLGHVIHCGARNGIVQFCGGSLEWDGEGWEEGESKIKIWIWIRIRTWNKKTRFRGAFSFQTGAGGS